MSRIKVPERFADVPLAELGLSIEDAAAAGARGARDVGWRSLVSPRRTPSGSASGGRPAGEESQAASQKMFTDQNEWMQDRSNEYRATYMRVLAGQA